MKKNVVADSASIHFGRMFIIPVSRRGSRVLSDYRGVHSRNSIAQGAMVLASGSLHLITW